MADYNTTSTLSDSIRTQYLADYIKGAVMNRLYDQLASPVGSNMAELSNGSSVQWNFLSALDVRSQTISETTDVEPVLFVDKTGSITKTSRMNNVVCSEKLLNTTYTDYGKEWYKRLGENMMEEVDGLARDAACQGSLVRRYGAAARTSLDPSTAAYELGKAAFFEASTTLANMKVPQYVSPRGKRWIAIIHPYAFKDLLEDTAILALGEYQKPGIILNNELGELGGFSIVVSPWAKVCYGAGAANATPIETTVGVAVTRGDTSVDVASETGITEGMRFLVGTHETGNTHYPMNEEVICAATPTTSTVSIIGQGENGGFRYSHAVGEAVSNDDHVCLNVFGGPESLVKVYDPEVGEYGELIPPYRDGSVKQFVKAGWKWYGNYGRISENRILRYETCTTITA